MTKLICFAIISMILTAVLVEGGRVHDSVNAQRIVNITLDTVMWVHEQHKGKMTWAELNQEVCHHMKVKRTEPWEQVR